jgi:hypothetical protein
MKWLSVGTIVGALVLAPAFASAQDNGSEALVARGFELRRAQNDAEALELFNRAYAIDHQPRTLAQIALAEQALGRWSDADEHLRAATAATSDPWIQRNAAALRASQEVIARHIGSLEVLGGVAGAEVFVDGVSIGTLPMHAPRRLVVGQVQLEVRARGYATAHHTVDIQAGQLTRESVALAPAPSETEPPGPVAPAIECLTLADQQRASAAPGYHDAAVATVSIGGAALAAGTVWWIVRATSRPASRAAVRVDVSPVANGAVLSAGASF